MFFPFQRDQGTVYIYFKRTISRLCIHSQEKYQKATWAKYLPKGNFANFDRESVFSRRSRARSPVGVRDRADGNQAKWHRWCRIAAIGVESRRRVYFQFGLSAHILCKVTACAWTTTTTRFLSQVRSQDRIASSRTAFCGRKFSNCVTAPESWIAPASRTQKEERRSTLLDLLMRAPFLAESNREIRVSPRRAADRHRHSRVTFFFLLPPYCFYDGWR